MTKHALDLGQLRPDTFKRLVPNDRPAPQDAILDVENLTLVSDAGDRLVNQASFSLRAGRTLGIVGESGSGKSLTCRAILGLLPDGVGIASGRIAFRGQELTGLATRDYRALRKQHFGAVFQDPGSYLNPSSRIGKQIEESLWVHRQIRGEKAREAAVGLLKAVGMADPEVVLTRFPFELSGGMQQRILIAIALSGEPDLLFADEVTTALDVVIQHQVIELLTSYREQRALSMIMVSHDLALVSQVCDDLIVMKDGDIIEQGLRSEVLASPQHVYTRALIANHLKYGIEVHE